MSAWIATLPAKAPFAAHYLHVVDSLCTAIGFGINATPIHCDTELVPQDALYKADDPHAEHLLQLLNGGIEIVTVLNEMARSLRWPDFYPFVRWKPVVAKLHFIHMVVVEARTNRNI